MNARIRELELMVAELADIVAHLTWGQHGDSNLHNRGIEIAARACIAAAPEPPKPEPEPTKPSKTTGRKFR